MDEQEMDLATRGLHDRGVLGCVHIAGEYTGVDSSKF